jgi:hypothetical protein
MGLLSELSILQPTSLLPGRVSSSSTRYGSSNFSSSGRAATTVDDAAVLAARPLDITLGDGERMPTSEAIIKEAITEFQLACQKYYICYAFAAAGLKDRADQFVTLRAERRETLIVSDHDPTEGNWPASINIGELINQSQRDGAFSDKIAKSFITAMYSEWDELYRHRVAAAAGVRQKEVKCDLMADLKQIRHCVVHEKSVLSHKHTKLKELNWRLSPGELRITADMFATLINQINKSMIVRVENGESGKSSIT